jgi:hypothetical protein
MNRDYMQPVAWIKKDRSSIEVSIMSSEYMVNLGFEPLYARPPAADVQELVEALQKAEAALSDIGDADREPEDDVAWCERRAAQDLQMIRAALAKWEWK